MKGKNKTLSILFVGVFLFAYIFLVGAKEYPQEDYLIGDNLYLLSSFTTSFYTSGNEKKCNIKIASNSINNTILQANEEFSFNRVVGRRTLEKGDKQAKIIMNERYVAGVGGGVCQVSTTLYNSALLAGLNVIEADPHSLPPSYVYPSFDAMVSYGTYDLKFVNNTGGVIIIKSYVENDQITMKIYGTEKPKYKIERKTEIIEYVVAKEEEVLDYNNYKRLNLTYNELGEFEIMSAKSGIKSNGYLIYYQNGKLVKTEKIRKDFYKPQKRVVIKKPIDIINEENNNENITINEKAS